MLGGLGYAGLGLVREVALIDISEKVLGLKRHRVVGRSWKFPISFH